MYVHICIYIHLYIASNYVAGTYHVTVITQQLPCEFDLHVRVVPFEQILRELDTDMGGQVEFLKSQLAPQFHNVQGR